MYQLKDKSLERRAKGHLILTLDVEYNPIRAAVRTVNPRDPKVMFEPVKFKRAVRIYHSFSYPESSGFLVSGSTAGEALG